MDWFRSFARLAPPMLRTIPAPLTLPAAASYDLTVAPYFPALRAFPGALLQALQSKAPLSALGALYATTNPLVSLTAAMFALMPIFFVVAEVNRNYSQVDRMWSILPVLMHAHYALWKRVSPGASGEFGRVDLVLAVYILWGSRLTYNYWRRGGYKVGSEDYRWEILQKQLGPYFFVALDIVFISTLQLILLESFTFPTYVMLLSEKVTGPGITLLDLGFAAAIVTLIGIEFTADQQQWNYHNAKAEYKKSAKAQPGYLSADLDKGFVTQGLWSYSRHPNFTAEQSIWCTLYLWSCAVTKTTYNWSGAGAIAILLLFQASTRLSEWISSDKYPVYKNYQEAVSQFIPIPGYTWSASASAKPATKKAASKKRQ